MQRGGGTRTVPAGQDCPPANTPLTLWDDLYPVEVRLWTGLANVAAGRTAPRRVIIGYCGRVFMPGRSPRSPSPAAPGRVKVEGASRACGRVGLIRDTWAVTLANSRTGNHRNPAPGRAVAYSVADRHVVLVPEPGQFRRDRADRPRTAEDDERLTVRLDELDPDAGRLGRQRRGPDRERRVAQRGRGLCLVVADPVLGGL